MMLRLSLLISVATFTSATTLPSFNGMLPRGGSMSSPEEAQGFPSQRMPSLFSPDETDYDRYAACLAATESLRRLRDKSMAESKKLSGTEATDEQKRIRAEYVINSSKVLKALGMSVSQFNQVGRQVNQDESLKEKVMEQAYLYRMAASLHMDRVPLVEDPDAEQLLRSHRKERVQMFCESMTEIEELRESQMERLKKSLQVDKLPSNMSLSDPAVKPFLSPKVIAVVEAFPLQAEAIVKKHGLHSDEFNRMLDQTKHNPSFRWKVEKEMKKVVNKEANADS
jgi:hypothetical protein